MKILFKNFFKNKISFFLSNLIIILLNFYLIFEVKNFFIHNDFIYYLQASQRVTLILFIFFLFLAYESTKEIIKENLFEIFSTIKNGLLKTYGNKILILTIILFIITANISIFNIILAFTINSSVDIIIHILLVNFLNIFLTSFLAILIGTFISSTLNGLISYGLIMLISILASPLIENINYTLLMGYNINIYPFTDFVNITPPNLFHVSDNLYGMSIEAYRWNLIIGWILIFITILLSKFKVTKKKFINSLLLPLALISLSLSLFKGSAPIKDFRKNGYIAADQMNYINKNIKETIANFKVLSYDLNFNIKRDLTATATIEIENPDKLLELDFTLYNGYKIKSIKANNNDLNYTQDNDFIKVNLPNENITNLTFEYKGSSPIHYSNKQAIFLPAYFAFYPVEGHQKIYDFSTYQYLKSTTNYDKNFKLKINNSNDIISNLNFKDGLFEGTTNSITILSGLINNHSNRDKAVFSSYNQNINLDLIDSVNEEILRLNTLLGSNKSIIDEKDTFIIYLPNGYSISKNINSIFTFKDHLLIPDTSAESLAFNCIFEDIPTVDYLAKKVLSDYIYLPKERLEDSLISLKSMDLTGYSSNEQDAFKKDVELQELLLKNYDQKDKIIKIVYEKIKASEEISIIDFLKKL